MDDRELSKFVAKLVYDDIFGNGGVYHFDGIDRKAYEIDGQFDFFKYARDLKKYLNNGGVITYEPYRTKNICNCCKD